MRHTGGPVGLVLTRQKLPVLDRTTLGSCRRNRARCLCADRRASERAPELILIATGSEVSLALAAHRATRAARPSEAAWCRCRRGSCSRHRPKEYRDSVLPVSVKARVSVEAADRPSDGSDTSVCGRRDHWRGPLRRLGARAQGHAALRLYGRERGGGGETGVLASQTTGRT